MTFVDAKSRNFEATIGPRWTATSLLESADLANVVVISAAAVILAVAGIFGGMQYAVSGLAIALAVLVLRQPREAVSSGLLFMLAVMTFLPSTARFHYIDAQTEGIDWQMYFWAGGSLLIVLAAWYRVKLTPLWRSPASLKVFLLVICASIIFGFARGNELSYVIRQAYGSFLFVSYFVIAWVFGDEELILQRLKSFGVLIALAFVVYYVSVFSTWGLHKEDTNLPIQFGILATLLFVNGLVKRSGSWMASASVLFLASFLLFFRHVLLAFFFAVALAMYELSRSRMRQILLGSLAMLIVLPSVFPFGAQFVLDVVQEKLPRVFDLLPAGTEDTKTLADRTIQLGAAAAVVWQSPVFGGGMGTELSWSSDLGNRDQAFIDNGWAYVGVKMGVAGILAFGWFLVTVLRCMSRRALAVSTTLLAILVIVMFSEPACFQFALSPIPASLAGLLYARRHPYPSCA